DINGLGRQNDLQLVLHAVNGRTNAFDGRVHSVRKIDRLPAKLDLATADATHIEQVVYHSDHLIDLTLQHLQRGLHYLVVAIRVLQDLHSVVNRSEWITKLVGEHGKEFVLVAIGGADGLLRLRSLDKVRGHSSKQVEPAQRTFVGSMRLAKMVAEHPQQPATATDQRRRLDGANAILEHDFHAHRVVQVVQQGDIFDNDTI